tara:strand:- start:8961 stop:9146 length:186 start_codon:yes stop_codon:yes gene_type:complete
MAYKLKEQYKNVKFDNMNYALADLNQKQIAQLSETYKNKFFTQDKPKTIKPKKDVEIEREI